MENCPAQNATHSDISRTSLITCLAVLADNAVNAAGAKRSNAPSVMDAAQSTRIRGNEPPFWRVVVSCNEERTAQCHCGLLRVIAAGEPERVYVCHCRACQRRTGAVVHSGCAYPKSQVRIEGDDKIYERDADSGFKIRFISARTAAATCSGKATKTPTSTGSRWAASPIRTSRRQPSRCGRR